jgi:hypothetical protein
MLDRRDLRSVPCLPRGTTVRIASGGYIDLPTFLSLVRAGGSEP